LTLRFAVPDPGNGESNVATAAPPRFELAERHSVADILMARIDDGISASSRVYELRLERGTSQTMITGSDRGFIEEMIRRPVPALQPEGICLFGSGARDDGDADRGFDLLVIGASSSPATVPRDGRLV
jgi:hypothetical protein